MHPVANGANSKLNGNTHSGNKRKLKPATELWQNLSTITTYPSQSLRFLEKLRDEPSIDNNDPDQARVKLNVIVVGAGLGGLALAIALARRGHTVQVLEKATKLGEVGCSLTGTRGHS